MCNYCRQTKLVGLLTCTSFDYVQHNQHSSWETYCMSRWEVIKPVWWEDGYWRYNNSLMPFFMCKFTLECQPWRWGLMCLTLKSVFVQNIPTPHIHQAFELVVHSAQMCTGRKQQLNAQLLAASCYFNQVRASRYTAAFMALPCGLNANRIMLCILQIILPCTGCQFQLLGWVQTT
jgi:hypothetical protein